MRIREQLQIGRIVYPARVSASAHILIQYRISRLPNTSPRVIISRTIVVKPRKLVIFLACELVWCAVDVVVFFYPGLSKGEVLDMLIDLSVGIRDKASTA